MNTTTRYQIFWAFVTVCLAVAFFYWRAHLVAPAFWVSGKRRFGFADVLGAALLFSFVRFLLALGGKR
jgi:hypothetical protein